MLDTVRELGLSKNTLVIFTSDNGGTRRGVNAPLRGFKGSTFEGGMREPALAWWPGHVPAGATCDELATAMDLLPTFAELSGAKAPADRVIDGKDISALLLGKPGAKSPHEAFFYYGRHNLRAVRSGQWKLHSNGALYDLGKDIGEKTNVAAKHPEVVKRLRAHMARARKDIGDGPNTGANCRPVGVAKHPRVMLPYPGRTGSAAYAPVGPKSRRKPRK